MKCAVILACFCLSTTLTLAADIVPFTCSATDVSVNHDRFSVHFDGDLHRVKTMSYLITDLRLNYAILRDGQTWSEGDLVGAAEMNRSDYSPRQYKNHIQFANVAPGQIQGQIDILLPSAPLDESLQTGRPLRPTHFQGQVSFRGIEKHVGATIPVICETR